MLFLSSASYNIRLESILTYYCIRKDSGIVGATPPGRSRAWNSLLTRKVENNVVVEVVVVLRDCNQIDLRPHLNIDKLVET